MSAVDMMFAFIMMFVIAICLVAFNVMYQAMNDNNIFAADTTGNATQALQEGGAVLSLMDTIFPILVIAVGLVMVLSGFLLETNPLFFVAMLLVNVVMIVINGALSNVYATFSTSAGIAVAANTFTYTSLIMNYFPYFAILLSVIVGIAMYAKGRSR